MNSVEIVAWEWMESSVDSAELRKQLTHKKSLKVMDARACMAVSVAMRLSAHFRAEPERIALAVGVEGDTLGDADFSSLSPLWLLGQLPNMVATHLAMQMNIRGGTQTCGTEHWAGMQALLCVVDHLQNNTADEGLVVIAERTQPHALALALKKTDVPTSCTLRDYRWVKAHQSPDALAVHEHGIVRSFQTMLTWLEKEPAGNPGFFVADSDERALEIEFNKLR